MSLQLNEKILTSQKCHLEIWWSGLQPLLPLHFPEYSCMNIKKHHHIYSTHTVIFHTQKKKAQNQSHTPTSINSPQLINHTNTMQGSTSLHWGHRSKTVWQRLRWSSGSVLPLSIRVRGFKPGRSRQDFSGRKNPRHAFLRKGSKAVGPSS